MSRILLGVAGGIAAYKACLLLRRFTEAGHDVTVVPTANALEFVGATTWAALSGHPVSTSVFERVDAVPHVALGQAAELVVVAPATADLLARAATGRADDLLTNVLLTASCPVLMAPAMHTEMWLHPATQANVATLRSRGVIVLDPADGRLTGADTGPGRLPEPEDIEAVALSLLGDEATVAAVRRRDLAGRSVVVSAGGTREHLDPVRFLGNASSGRQGVEIARAAALRGARVTLVAAHVEVGLPSGVRLVRAHTTGELADAMTAAAADADVIVMAAAPADFTPAAASDVKIKKSGDNGLDLHLVQTTDILAGLSAHRARAQVVVGFAAETASDRDDLLALGRAKLARKGCDLLVLNNVSGGAVFGQPSNDVVILDADGVVCTVSGEKSVVAHRILDAVAGR
ncbi:bifunctional phosphopantothenoylcysteine decarboxylase/phosphopantothenate--cysteine ligase CoaBC [Propioniciclava tarda]|uniref:Coenzyme A biosynthesis bifunctional protein CoaBC n=1 Tax=Propioniciclava tarda TaxID=433330 RepID=A0A4Q9KPS4_PROTD|nr:bifunctional phosphopantothenoylcysteine decarboxylase/phosphopantothenate--cysteine ligase CoaBC [Propioniciclava tarda]TBT95879.1 bifunctional phosphopantothenoylcysteine decarboxylase/phosphopantothenate--cysteine ligase CoaBC [Propioniciclava tarda]SMO40991.1 Phosphopantothenate-cysteine ligase /Phosphopantothenoylcysteine decarboxylase [Propioniciclava tarda]